MNLESPPGQASTSLPIRLIQAAQAMGSRGLSVGTSGNLSVRANWRGMAGFWITPTGMAYEYLQENDIPFVSLDGQAHGQRKPSSEWRIHRDIYAARQDAQSIVHAHSPFATALACKRLEIPPFHYMIARFGGTTLRCAAYATFGTQNLSDHVLAALDQRSGCLMANHGMITFGNSPENALDLAQELETLAQQYWHCLSLGGPVLLSEHEILDALELFSGYGKQ